MSLRGRVIGKSVKSNKAHCVTGTGSEKDCLSVSGAKRVLTSSVHWMWFHYPILLRIDCRYLMHCDNYGAIEVNILDL